MPSNQVPPALLSSLWQVLGTFLHMPVVWIAVTIGILGAIYRRPVVKGWVGEKILSLWLRLFLDKNRYRVLDDITIPDDQGGTTQIDHVVVSVFGIFVIETKNLGGWIFGSEQDATWTQKLHGRHSQKFQNPLRQNYKHTMTLASVLGMPHERFVSVVVFVGNATLKTAHPDRVTYPGGCTRLIKSHREPVLTEEEAAQVIAAIGEIRLKPGRETRREHVAYLRTKHAAAPMPELPDPAGGQDRAVEPQAPAEPCPEPAPPASATSALRDRECPWCHNLLVLRTVRSGPNAGRQFWGCRGFPKCRYTTGS